MSITAKIKDKNGKQVVKKFKSEEELLSYVKSKGGSVDSVKEALDKCKDKKGKKDNKDVVVNPKDSEVDESEQPRAKGEKRFKDFHDKNTKIKKHPVEE